MWDNKLYGWDLTGQPWCDIFVDYCFVEAYGYQKAKELTYQYDGCSGAACAYSAQYYKNNGAFYSYPEIGDQIFFYVNQPLLDRLSENVDLSFWEKADETHSIVRIATSWATQAKDVDALCKLLKEAKQNLM